MGSIKELEVRYTYSDKLTHEVGVERAENKRQATFRFDPGELSPKSRDELTKCYAHGDHLVVEIERALNVDGRVFDDLREAVSALPRVITLDVPGHVDREPTPESALSDAESLIHAAVGTASEIDARRENQRRERERAWESLIQQVADMGAEAFVVRDDAGEATATATRLPLVAFADDAPLRTLGLAHKSVELIKPNNEPVDERLRKPWENAQQIVANTLGERRHRRNRVIRRAIVDRATDSADVQRYDEGLMPEAEIKSFVREELFGDPGLDRSKPVRGSAIRHTDECELTVPEYEIDCDSGPPDEGVPKDAYMRLQELRSYVTELERNYDKTLREGLEKGPDVEVIEHRCVCENCHKKELAYSAKVSLTWCGIPFSRQYRLDG